MWLGVVECNLLFHFSTAYLCNPVSLALEAHEITLKAVSDCI